MIYILKGAHTIGTANIENSGLKGDLGWVRHNRLLTNEYYDFLHQIFWEHELVVQNKDNDSRNTIHQQQQHWLWRSPDGEIMLNVDIALVRNFTNSLNKETGEVTCDLRMQEPKNKKICPFASSQLIRYVEEYRMNNILWIQDFRDAFMKMIHSGYEWRKEEKCLNIPCSLLSYSSKSKYETTAGGGSVHSGFAQKTINNSSRYVSTTYLTKKEQSQILKSNTSSKKKPPSSRNEMIESMIATAHAPTSQLNKLTATIPQKSGYDTSSPRGQDQNVSKAKVDDNNLKQILEKAQNDIIKITKFDRRMRAKFVRLAFHDCIGLRCDGCVNMKNTDNKGLEIPIKALQHVAKVAMENSNGLISRADIWALAGFVGAQESQTPAEEDAKINTGRVDFSMNWIGRIDCYEGAMSGPNPSLPSPNLYTQGVLDFFKKEFGFNERETVAIMGAHTIGTAKKENSGYDGQLGWVRNNLVLNNEYYDYLTQIIWNHELIIIDNKNNDDSLKASSNDDHNAIATTPIRHRRHWLWRNPHGREIMLNSDISLVRDLQKDMIGEDGEVICRLRTMKQQRAKKMNNDNIICPHGRQFILEFVEYYRLNNDLWLKDFRDAFTKVILNGYKVLQGNNQCVTKPCQLKAL